MSLYSFYSYVGILKIGKGIVQYVQTGVEPEVRDLPVYHPHIC